MNSKKRQLNTEQILVALFAIFIPLTTYALGIPELLGLVSKQESKSNFAAEGRESIQSLKVFEAEKIYGQNSTVSLKNVVDYDSNTFVAGENFTDDLSGDSHEKYGNNTIYTVQKGDSIYSIADYFNVTAETIMTFNNKKVITVRVGDVLEIPSVSGILYEVKKGDTLSSIVKKYNVEAEEVLLHNGLVDNETIAIGEEIFLPGAKEIEVKKTEPKIKIKIAKGSTAQFNTSASVKKYSSLPKYSNYYMNPSPGATRTQKMHGYNAVDLANKLGSPLLASAGGTVRVSKNGGYNSGYGNYVIITHPNGSETIYAHMLQTSVSPGQAVTKGQQIGQVGSSGNSTGPHVHFEVRGAYNPFAW
jgi:murein DD-endopeptidase MepM/ murein hydrolase activator NlpD